jgi:hypothetical protein
MATRYSRSDCRFRISLNHSGSRRSPAHVRHEKNLLRVVLSEPFVPLCVLLLIEELEEANMGRGILLWLLGVPIPVIILLWLFFGR